MPEGTKTDAGEAGAEGVGAEEEEAEVFDGPRALALRVPGKVIMGSSRFQQFFLMYAKLMVGLRDSKVRESDMTLLATHWAMMSVGKPNREELHWAICEIWLEMSEPKSISIFISSP